MRFVFCVFFGQQAVVNIISKETRNMNDIVVDIRVRTGLQQTKLMKTCLLCVIYKRKVKRFLGFREHMRQNMFPVPTMCLHNACVMIV